MKKAILAPIFLILTSSLVPMICQASTEVDYVPKYYHKLDSNDGTGQLFIRGSFFDEVPSSAQAEVLADILDRADSATPQDLTIIKNVIQILNGFQGTVTWNSHLEKSILAEAKNPDPNVRSLLVSMLANARKDQNRDLVISFQNDPDENVRYSAIHAIIRWPDADAVYQQFIQDHQSDPKYAKSVQAAQNHIKAVHDSQKSEEK